MVAGRMPASCCARSSPRSRASGSCSSGPSRAGALLHVLGFIVLFATIIEAYGALFDPDFAIPVVGRWAVLGFLEDFFAVAVLVGSITFAVIRVRQRPGPAPRGSRFYGSHTGAAWLVLGHDLHVVWTLFVYRGAQINAASSRTRTGGGRSPRRLPRSALEPLGETSNESSRRSGSCCRSRVILGFLVIVVHSKHLHIAWRRSTCSPSASRRRWARCCRSGSSGKPRRLREPRRARRGHRSRRRQDRGLHLEGPARLRHLHRVRALPVAVPGVEHRQAAVAKLVILQLRDHRSPRRRTCWREARPSSPPTAGPTGLPVERRIPPSGGRLSAPLVGRDRRRRSAMPDAAAASSTRTCCGPA